MEKEKITKESNPEKHEALKRVWKREGRPGHIVLPKAAYRVNIVDDEIEFIPTDFTQAYGSTGF